MPGGAKLLLLLVTFLGLGMGLHQDLGLQRALTPKPQHILAANRSAVPAMLNQVLLEHHRLTFTPCADWSLSDLASLYATLLPLTSPELASIYEAKSDRRRMRHTSMEGWLREAAEASAAATAHPSLLRLIRAGRCAECVMIFIHNLHATVQEELALITRLPLLEVNDVSTWDEEAEQDSGKWVGVFEDQTSCFDCHTHTDNKSGTDGPHLWPENFNGTLWMFADEGYMQSKTVDYRWSSDGPQYLNEVLTTPDERTQDCVVLFDNDDSVWEWHTQTQTCTKIFEQVPMMSPAWTQFMNQSYGKVAVYNSATNETTECSKFCAPNQGPCICEAEQNGVANAPIWHSHVEDCVEHPDCPGGWSFYTDMTLTPELVGARIERPAYCPVSTTAPLFNESMCPGLDDCLQATCFNCLDT